MSCNVLRCTDADSRYLSRPDEPSSSLQRNGVQALVERLLIKAKDPPDEASDPDDIPHNFSHFVAESLDGPTYAEINQLMRMIDETRMTLEYLEEHLEVITGGCIPECCITYARRRMRGR